MNCERRLVEDNVFVILQKLFLECLAVVEVGRFNDAFHFHAVNVFQPRTFMHDVLDTDATGRNQSAKLRDSA